MPGHKAALDQKMPAGMKDSEQASMRVPLTNLNERQQMLEQMQLKFQLDQTQKLDNIMNS